ncbi:hypothetical protein PCAR4_290014 [Paraburkholderia caribensis]|nr:hypothetical protein PCAR4_290014 [Paraburkholderia caribensis]
MFSTSGFAELHQTTDYYAELEPLNAALWAPWKSAEDHGTDGSRHNPEVKNPPPSRVARY